ncbi:hypothetical protein [Micromonospora sp. NPDC005806]|uniref:hypothetical protein n=1 Tax=Micromonospora sp. NPDC005806 TaxID=3364234 RepID=UPI0036D0824E
MADVAYVLFVYFLVTVPVLIGLALVAQLTRAVWARRAAEVVLITGGAALIPVVLERAFEKPVLWLVVALLAVVLVFGLTMHVKSYRRSS